MIETTKHDKLPLRRSKPAPTAEVIAAYMATVRTNRITLPYLIQALVGDGRNQPARVAIRRVMHTMPGWVEHITPIGRVIYLREGTPPPHHYRPEHHGKAEYEAKMKARADRLIGVRKEVVEFIATQEKRGNWFVTRNEVWRAVAYDCDRRTKKSLIRQIMNDELADTWRPAMRNGVWGWKSKAHDAKIAAGRRAAALIAAVAPEYESIVSQKRGPRKKPEYPTYYVGSAQSHGERRLAERRVAPQWVPAREERRIPWDRRRKSATPA